MTPDAFWKIVDRAARSDDDEESLRRSLSRLTADEVAAFDALFYDFVDRAMTWDVWGAAYLAMGGCSEDGFEYARRGMVARGRKFYERVLANPDALAKLDDPEDIENEEIGYVAAEVYEEKTGRAPPRVRRRAKPAGRRWDFEDRRACAKRLPKLAARMAAEASEASDASDAGDAPAAPSARTKSTARERAAMAKRTLFDAMVTAAWQREASDVDAAIAEYEAALAFADETSPMFPLAHRNVAYHYGQRGEIARAWPHIEAALRTRDRLAGMTPYPARLEAAVARFLFEHAPERIDEALALARAAQKRPGIERDVLLSAVYAEIEILIELGRDKDARKAVLRGLALNPKDKEFRAAKKQLGF